MEKLNAIWHHAAMSDSGEKDGFPSDAADRFQVRMPPGMRDRIAKVAKQNGRSMNAEIVTRLDASLAQIERMNETLYHGERPLELDNEIFEGMMALFQRARAKHDEKYGVTPPELREPFAFPLRVREPELVKTEDLSEVELQEGLKWLDEEKERLSIEMQRRTKPSD